MDQCDPLNPTKPQQAEHFTMKHSVAILAAYQSHKLLTRHSFTAGDPNEFKDFVVNELGWVTSTYFDGVWSFLISKGMIRIDDDQNNDITDRGEWNLHTAQFNHPINA